MARLDAALGDLRVLQVSLAGSGAPVQTSRGLLGRSFASLPPRQRETLAESLQALAAQGATAREAAAAEVAGTAEVAAAQAAAVAAERAVRLVADADAAEPAGDGEAARQEAFDRINRLEIDQIVVAPDEMPAPDETEDAWRMRGVKPGFGMVTATTGSTTGRPAAVTFHRRTAREFEPDKYLSFHADFQPHGALASQRIYGWNGGDAWPGSAVSRDGRPPAWGVSSGGVGGEPDDSTDNDYARPAGRLAPPAVLYAAGQKPVIASDPNTSTFRARGSVYRAGLRSLPLPVQVSDAANYVFSDLSIEDYLRSADENVLDASFTSPVHVDFVLNRVRIGVSSSTAINRQTNAKLWQQALRIQGQDINPDPYSWNPEDQTARTTFRYDANGGLTMGFGGDGVVFADLERFRANRCYATYIPSCNNAITADIEISFGAPDFDPLDQGMFYWSSDVVSPRLNADGAAADAPAGRDHGQYHLLLSNGAGAGRRTLSYAAYGLFNFLDGLSDPPNVEYGRAQTFHYGAEAFADESGRRVSDMERIAATFRGRTHGWVIQRNLANSTRWGALRRIRGDVTLTAAIGGSDADVISGEITNLRQSPFHDREAAGDLMRPWTAGLLPETVRLQGAYANGVIGVAPILAETGATTTPAADFAALGVAYGSLGETAAVGADGAFKGTVTASGERADNWERGEYEGALYGPTAALEAAGTWWLQADRSAAGGRAGPRRTAEIEVNFDEPRYTPDYPAIIGSFGAVCETGCD